MCTQAAPANRHLGDGPGMTLKHKVLVVSVLAGLLLWLADAAVHFLFFHDEPFLDLLPLRAPTGETVQCELYARNRIESPCCM